MPRRLVRGRLEVSVAEATAATTRDQRLLARGDEIGQQLACRVVEDRRAWRHREVEILAGLAVPPRALAPTARLGLEVMGVAEVAQRRLAGVDADEHGAAAAAVSAVRPAARDVRLATEGRGAVAATSRADPDFHAVEEHRPNVLTRSGRNPARSEG
jgi:hypothetical protein